MQFFIQIGGQGALWLNEFSRYYGEPSMKKFYDTVIDTIESEISKFAEFREFYSDFQPQKWLEKSYSLPNEVYFSRALVSMAMIQATQLAHFEYIRVHGVESKSLLEKTVGITGHSQGIVTATFIALALDGEDYYKGIADYTRYLLHLSYQSQLVHPAIYASEEESAKSASLNSANPEPMVAVLGGEHLVVEGLVNKLNKSLTEEEQICVGLYNSSTNRVLSGLRSSLIKFNKLVKKEIDGKELKYIYLRSSSPFHSPVMKKAIIPFTEQLSKIDFLYQGSDLKVPVYSFSDGRNMQDDASLGESLCAEIITNTLHWKYAIKTLIEPNDIDTVIDLGPSKVSHRLSEEILKFHQKKYNFYVLSNTKSQNDLIKVLK